MGVNNSFVSDLAVQVTTTKFGDVSLSQATCFFEISEDGFTMKLGQVFVF